MKQLLNLLKIKSLVTLMVTIAVIYMAIQTQTLEPLKDSFLIIIGFYFGTQANKE